MKAHNESIKQAYELKRKNYNRNLTETLATFDDVTPHEAEILFTDQIRTWLYDESDVSHWDISDPTQLDCLTDLNLNSADFQTAGHYNSGKDLILADNEVVSSFTIGDWYYFMEVEK
jgi:hypothetical protein